MWVRFEKGYSSSPYQARLLHCLHREFSATSGKECANNRLWHIWPAQQLFIWHVKCKVQRLHSKTCLALHVVCRCVVKIGSLMGFVMVCYSAAGFSVFAQRHHYTTPTPEPISWSSPQSVNSSHLLTNAVRKATIVHFHSSLLFPDPLTFCRPCQSLFLHPASPQVTYTLHSFPLQGREFFVSRGIRFCVSF